jgi:hypothetical protein
MVAPCPPGRGTRFQWWDGEYREEDAMRLGIGRGLALGLVAAAALAGCDRTLFAKWRNRVHDFRTTPNVKIDARRLESGMDVLRVRAVKDAAPSFGFLRMNHDLRPPFQVQVSVGGLDPSLVLPSFPGTGCLELDVRDSDPLLYYGMCFQAFAEGAQAFAYKNGSSNLGAVVFYGANALDLRIEADGDSLDFFARETGTLPWQPVASTPYVYDGNPLVPAVGSNALQKGTGVSFAMAALDGNGPEDEGTEPAPAAAVPVDAALAYYFLLCRTLDSLTPDLPLAREQLVSMRETIGSAATRAGDLPESRETLKAEKILLSVGARLDRAIGYLDDGKPADKVLKEATKAADKAGDALPLLRGFKTKL